MLDTEAGQVVLFDHNECYSGSSVLFTKGLKDGQHSSSSEVGGFVEHDKDSRVVSDGFAKVGSA